MTFFLIRQSSNFLDSVFLKSFTFKNKTEFAIITGLDISPFFKFLIAS